MTIKQSLNEKGKRKVKRKTKFSVVGFEDGLESTAYTLLLSPPSTSRN